MDEASLGTGLTRALDDARIPFDPALVRVGAYQGPVSRAAAVSLLSGPDRPTAVFAANDLSALGALHAVRSLGIRVPEELSVVGFDDVPEAAQSVPPLTTVRQSMRRLGAEAVAMLFELLRGEQPRTPYVTLPTRLVERQTTAAPLTGTDLQSSTTNRIPSP